MSYNIIPFILIIVSIAVILVIIIKKFPNIIAIDVETIPSEKEKKKKEEIIKKRFNRVLVGWKKNLVPKLKPLAKGLLSLFKKAYNKIIELEKLHKRKAALSGDNKKDLSLKIRNMLVEAAELVKKEEWAVAEKKYIEIISWDSKNIEAYKGLAEMYYGQKEYKQAKETLEYVLKIILPEDGKIDDPKLNITSNQLAVYYFDLGQANFSLEEYDDAFQNFKMAAELEEKSPKYLDRLIEISMMNRNKLVALDTLKKLKEVNPDNQKLEEFEERIREM